jgi:ParB family transcriptional regulator, chromosome partitioning protein
LSPLEQAISIERLHQQFNMTYKQIAERLAKAETTVSNLVRLLQLPENARDALAEGKISEGHARAILALKNTPELQTELLEQIIKNTWSVRQAEQFVTTHKQGIVKDKTVKERMATETAETKQLSKKLHTPVSVRRTAKGGRLELHFKTDEELQKLIELLNKL